jgi:hypothetical protein
MSDNKKKPVSSSYNQGDNYMEVTYNDGTKEKIPIRGTPLGGGVVDKKKKNGDNNKDT